MSTNLDNIQIDILEEEGFMLERYYYEYTGLTTLVEQFSKNSEYELSEAKYKSLLADYLESYISYNMTWDYLREKYNVTQFGDEYNATVDFSIPAIKISKSSGGCTSCRL